MHTIQRRQLTDRLVTLHRCQCHLGLEPRGMGLPFLCHDYPFLGQPTVAYSTVQFLGSTSTPSDGAGVAVATEALGRETQYTLDSLGRVTSLQTPDSQTETFQRNDAGLV